MIDTLVLLAQVNVDVACKISSLNTWFFLMTRSEVILKVRNIDYSKFFPDVIYNDYRKNRGTPPHNDKDATELNYCLPFGAQIGTSLTWYNCVEDFMIYYYKKNDIKINWYNRCVASILSGEVMCPSNEMRRFHESIFYKVGHKFLINMEYGKQWLEDKTSITKCEMCLVFPLRHIKVCPYCSENLRHRFKPGKVEDIKMIYTKDFNDRDLRVSHIPTSKHS